jgi:thiamine pyrophosphokinase
MKDSQPASCTVIVADGTFPTHEIPFGYLKSANRIICCDGSAENLIMAGYIPDAIVGDMDSLSEKLSQEFANRIFSDENQDTNDLTKAVIWCSKNEFKNIVIVGATGKREDHTIGNISLLTEYQKYVDVIMVTDTGTFQPFSKSCKVTSMPGQQVSLFSIDPDTEVTSAGLKYPLSKTKLINWWVATLNESIGNSFTLEFDTGRIIVYLKFT